MKQKNKLKPFIYIYALFLVLCFSVITMAKYTGVTSENAAIAVAKWDVSLSGEDNQVLPTITIGDSSTYQNYDLRVISQSEVAINYSLIIDNVPSDLIVKVDETSYTTNTGRIVVDNLGSFSANDNESIHLHTLSFIVPIGSDTINNRKLDLDVVFTQVNM